MIKKYLFPLDKDKTTEERVAMELSDLKNKMSFAFLLANGIFVVVMFTLQMNTGTLAIPWPCGENLRIEPLGFFFLCFFALIMVIQTIGMVTHRMTTFLHICASTTLAWCQKPDKRGDEVTNAIELAKNLGALKEDDTASEAVTEGDDDDDAPNKLTRARGVTGKIQRAKTRRDKENVNKSVDQVFTRRMEKLAHQLEYEDNTPEEIEKRVLGRKDSVGIARRKSVSAIKFLQSRRDRDQRGRGYSNASSIANRSPFNTTRSLDEIGLTHKPPMTAGYSLDGGGTKKDLPRMSIVTEDGEKPPLPPKPTPRLKGATEGHESLDEGKLKPSESQSSL